MNLDFCSVVPVNTPLNASWTSNLWHILTPSNPGHFKLGSFRRTYPVELNNTPASRLFRNFQYNFGMVFAPTDSNQHKCGAAITEHLVLQFKQVKMAALPYSHFAIITVNMRRLARRVRVQNPCTITITITNSPHARSMSLVKTRKASHKRLESVKSEILPIASESRLHRA